MRKKRPFRPSSESSSDNVELTPRSERPRLEPRPDLGEQLGCLVGRWLANQADQSRTAVTPKRPRSS